MTETCAATLGECTLTCQQCDVPDRLRDLCAVLFRTKVAIGQLHETDPAQTRPALNLLFDFLASSAAHAGLTITKGDVLATMAGLARATVRVADATDVPLEPLEAELGMTRAQETRH